MTRSEFAEATLPLAAAFDRPMTPERLELLWAALKHFEVEHVRAAVNRSILTHEFNAHPPVALLLRFADEAAHGIELTADQAVDLIWKSIRKHAGWDMDSIRAAHADLGPKIVAAMNAAGGYGRFQECSSSEKGTLIAQFREAWNANVRRDEQARRLPAATLPRVNGPEVHRLESTPVTPRLVAQGANS